MRKRFKGIICLILSLTAAVGLMLVRDSAAWFKIQAGSPVGTQTLTVKQFNFTFTGSLNSFLEYDNSVPFVITDRNLISSSYQQAGSQVIAVYGVNSSTVATEVRFKIFYTHPTTGLRTEYGAGYNIMSATAGSGWDYDSATHYFTRSFEAASTTGTRFDLLTDLRFSESAASDPNGANITSVNPAFDGKIIIAIQARQAGNMIWEDLGSIESTPSTPTFVDDAFTETVTGS